MNYTVVLDSKDPNVILCSAFIGRSVERDPRYSNLPEGACFTYSHINQVWYILGEGITGRRSWMYL